MTTVSETVLPCEHTQVASTGVVRSSIAEAESVASALLERAHSGPVLVARIARQLAPVLLLSELEADEAGLAGAWPVHSVDFWRRLFGSFASVRGRSEGAATEGSAGQPAECEWADEIEDDVHLYLVSHPAVEDVVRWACRRLRERFPRATVAIRMHTNPEEDDRFPVIEVRSSKFDLNFLHMVDEVADEVAAQLQDIEGWCLVVGKPNYGVRLG